MAHKKTLKLKDGHPFTAKPGHKIFIADRGAVRFDIPVDWAIVVDADGIKLYDKQPPNDDCGISVSIFNLPPIDWSGLPLAPLLEESMKGTEQEITSSGEIIQVKRGDLEIVWRESHVIDPKEKREAVSRVLMGRRKLIQCLITLDFWPADLERCDNVWKTVIETLRLSEYIADPTTGRPMPGPENAKFN